MGGERKSGVKKSQIKLKSKSSSKKSSSRDRDRDDSDSESEDLRRGDRVEAKCTGWTKYYGGEITRVNRDGTYDIKFDDGERKSGVKKSQIKSKSKSSPKKSSSRDRDRDDSDSESEDLRRGDRVEAKCTGWTKYYDGEITRVNRDGTYDIKFDDGGRKSGVKKSQIKSRSSSRNSEGRNGMDSELRVGSAVKARFMGG